MTALDLRLHPHPSLPPSRGKGLLAWSFDKLPSTGSGRTGLLIYICEPIKGEGTSDFRNDDSLSEFGTLTWTRY